MSGPEVNGRVTAAGESVNAGDVIDQPVLSVTVTFQNVSYTVLPSRKKPKVILEAINVSFRFVEFSFYNIKAYL